MSTKKVRITQKELIEKVAETVGFTKTEVHETLKAFAKVLENLAKETVGDDHEAKATIITPVGTFRVEWTKERKGRNPQTGEEITIPSKLVIKLKKVLER